MQKTSSFLQPVQALAAQDVNVYLVRDRLIKDSGLLDSYRSILDEEEQARFQRFHFEEHSHQFLLSRALMRGVLGSELSISPADVKYSRNEWGKPSLNSQQNPHKVCFNLSHTKGLVALVVTRETDIGVDVESIHRSSELLALADRFFSPDEANALRELPQSAHQERFFSLWTLKESYIKAAGRGLAIPLDSFSFDLENNGVISCREDENFNIQSYAQYDCPEDYRLALALKDGKTQIENIKFFEGVPGEGFSQVLLPLLRVSDAMV